MLQLSGGGGASPRPRDPTDYTPGRRVIPRGSGDPLNPPPVAPRAVNSGYVAPPVAAPVRPVPTSTGALTPPVPPSLDAIPLDDSYNAAVRALNDNLSAYKGTYSTNRQRAGESAALTNQQLGINETNDLRNLLNSFAARGLVDSSSYGYNYGDEQNQYQRQFANVSRQQGETYADLDRQLADFQRQTQNSIDQAKADAIARRSALYGSINLPGGGQ